MGDRKTRKRNLESDEVEVSDSRIPVYMYSQELDHMYKAALCILTKLAVKCTRAIVSE